MAYGRSFVVFTFDQFSFLRNAIVPTQRHSLPALPRLATCTIALRRLMVWPRKVTLNLRTTRTYLKIDFEKAGRGSKPCTVGHFCLFHHCLMVKHLLVSRCLR